MVSVLERELTLSPDERLVFARTKDIIALQGARPRGIREIRVSQTMRINASGTAERVGLWDEGQGRIVIKRDQLRGLPTYAGTLLHEVTHARSQTPDVSSDFEDALTHTLGAVAARYL